MHVRKDGRRIQTQRQFLQPGLSVFPNTLPNDPPLPEKHSFTMGAKGVRIASSQEELNTFTRQLLGDVQAMEYMLEQGWFENDDIKIGAEQEICLIDEHGKPAPKCVELLQALDHNSFTTELARFNLEANMTPQPFSGDCFSRMEAELKGLMDYLRVTAEKMDVMPILTGILPTIRKFDLEMDNLTPIDRYYALMNALTKLRGENFDLRIEGLDELNIKQSSALIEACNTSFQVHLQIKPDEFVERYNIALATAAPVLAIATNSPMLFGKRLWHETRIALFQQSIDTRVTGEHLRFTSPRVTFGNSWLRNSILDLYKEDIVRFKVLLMTDVDEDVPALLAEHKTPKLKALSIHNSTVYRWNRPCYGISPNGKPHLRIENRIFPAGPTVTDEIANAAFWIGLMNGFGDAYKDITRRMDFDDAKSNFLKVAQGGMGTRFNWMDGRVVSDTELIEKELLPIAREGLKKANVDKRDIDRFLGVIQERNEMGTNGSRWALNSYSHLLKETTREEATTALVVSIAKNQAQGEPIHKWPLATIHSLSEWEPASLLVEEFMTTDLFTVSQNDLPEFCADLMDWQRIRYIPIENEQGELIGLMTSRRLLRYLADLYKNHQTPDPNITIKDLMRHDPITVRPEATVIEAMELMRSHNVGCLPVVNKNKLVGIITESNFLNITASLFKRFASRKKLNKVQQAAAPEAPKAEGGGKKNKSAS